MHKNCEFCKKEFEIKRKKQKGRFCSSLCNRKMLRSTQLLKYENYLANETEEQKLKWLKDHYEKFVIKKENDCWDWKGNKVHGYANFNHRGKILKAHRASWMIHNGPIPNGMFVLHKCDIRHCSNPEHLFLGNQTDNMKDMAFKGRTKILFGEENKSSVLTKQQVIEIKKLLRMSVPMTRISKNFNVNKNTIASIKYGKTWKHIEI